jgi:hypothetical protein
MGKLIQLRPGMIDRRRSTNWGLVLVLAGLLIIWLVLVIAVLRVLA